MKNIKVAGAIIIILALLVLGLTGFIIYDKVFTANGNNKENISSGSTTKANNYENEENIKITGDFNIPNDLSDYSLLYWNYEELYNYYFKMNNSDKKININAKFKDVKIDNNKLHWNIDNKWTIDKTITDDVNILI